MSVTYEAVKNIVRSDCFKVKFLNRHSKQRHMICRLKDEQPKLDDGYLMVLDEEKNDIRQVSLHTMFYLEFTDHVSVYQGQPYTVVYKKGEKSWSELQGLNALSTD